MDAASAQQLFDAYRKGLLNREGARREDYHPRFQVLLRQLLSNQVPLAHRLPVRKVWLASAQGLRLAREGHLEAAAACLDSVTETLAQTSSFSVGRLMATSVLESAHAYLDFCGARFDQAREGLRRAMDADLALEHDETFGLLELHRIQSAQNLMRLEFRVGRPEVACALGGKILGYLEDLTSGLPVHHSWQRQALSRAPRTVRRAMVTQIGNEMSLGLARNRGLAAWSHFSSELKSHPGYAKEGTAIHLRVQQWVHLKDAFEQRDWPRYLVLLAAFLPGGRKDVQSVWYSSVIDFLYFCRAVDSAAFRQVRSGILRDASKWPAVPPSVRSCLPVNEGE